MVIFDRNVKSLMQLVSLSALLVFYFLFPIGARGQARESKTIVLGKKDKVSILTSADVNTSGAVYVIEGVLDLNGKELEIPENCRLDFQGGEIQNGCIIFNKTVLSGDICISANNIGFIYNEDGVRLSNNGFIKMPYDRFQVSLSFFSDKMPRYTNVVKEMGLCDVVLCLGLEYDSDYNIHYRYKGAEFNSVIRQCKRHNLNIVGVKFHQQGSFDKSLKNKVLAEKWKSFVCNEIEKYSTINTMKYVAICNENRPWTKPNSMYIPYILEVNDFVHRKGLVSYIANGGKDNIKKLDPKLDKIDIIAVNSYPFISNDGEKAKMTPEVLDNIDRYFEDYYRITKMKFPRADRFALSETGTTNRVNALVRPSLYGEDKVGEISPTDTPLRVYWETMFTALKDRKWELEFISMWFINNFRTENSVRTFREQLFKFGILEE